MGPPPPIYLGGWGGGLKKIINVLIIPLSRQEWQKKSGVVDGGWAKTREQGPPKSLKNYGMISTVPIPNNEMVLFFSLTPKFPPLMTPGLISTLRIISRRNVMTELTINNYSNISK